ncbi:MAG: hypothetical protein LZF86_110948 [Nitrospira sp.]|nr:MAG: hypothetical protein LZF86_110948 [Nitrospira sp.]
MEYKDIVHVPRWVKLVALAILIVAFGAGVLLAHAAFYQDKRDWIAPALNLAQFSAFGVAAALVLLFAEREMSVNRLCTRLDAFFSQSLRQGLEKIRMPAFGKLNGEPVRVSMDHQAGQPRAFYTIHYKEFSLLVQVDANVRQIVVMYCFPVDQESSPTGLNQHFEATSDGAKGVGWSVSSVVAREPFDNQYYYELFFRKTLETPFLLNPSDMFFWITDIAIMTRSALLHGIESKVLRPQLTNEGLAPVSRSAMPSSSA